MNPMTKRDVWFKDLPPAEQEEKIREIGRRLFSTQEGVIWLTAVLDDLHYGTHAVTEREVGLKNYATTLLRERIGTTRDSIAVTAALLNIGQKEPVDDNAG